MFGAVCCYFQIHQILYLFSEYFLESIQSNKFFFSSFSDLLYFQYLVSFVISFYICLPFFLLNFLYFFFSSIRKHRQFFVIWFLFFFFICYFGAFFFFFTYVLPEYVDAYLPLEKENLFYTLHFEAKIEDYF